jgi:putative component of toxin-antitoxin plasmid stabilization module
MLEILQTEHYRQWFNKLKDKKPASELIFALIILLAGGDKTTQTDDIAKAKLLVHEIEV